VPDEGGRKNVQEEEAIIQLYQQVKNSTPKFAHALKEKSWILSRIIVPSGALCLSVL
jgi:hypothetical protein